MCHFITAVLPDTAPHAALDAIARRHGRQFRPMSNPSIERQLRPDQRYFFTTMQHCDCGTVLGDNRRRAHRAPDWMVEEQRLVKKGWSANKVALALAQKREHAADADQARREAPSAELASWVQLVAEVLDSRQSPELGLLLHLYRGPLDEDIQLLGTETVLASSVTGEMLGDMREDVLYVFRR